MLYSAIGIWLGWQILLGPITQRAPPELAIRLAPTSSLVLSRGAEMEYAAGRNENADFLARARLRQSPFDVRALRVAGLVAARNGESEQANEIVTLAGNWSLRDDPSHAWLIEYRLRMGDYVSAFAHADTLVRRREDIQQQVFKLFTTAATKDRRSLPVLVNLLSTHPAWSPNYFDVLYRSPEGLQLAANLALGLQRTDGPLPDMELRRLYYFLVETADPAGVAALRTRLNRPPAPPGFVIAGNFEASQGVQPFGWRFSDQSGLVAEIAESPTAGNALNVIYQGFGAEALVDQLVVLPPGLYELRGVQMTDDRTPPASLMWSMTCAGAATGRVVMSEPVFGEGDRGAWHPFSIRLQVPAQGCPVQWLKLDAASRDRTRALTVWFDNLSLVAN